MLALALLRPAVELLAAPSRSLLTVMYLLHHGDGDLRAVQKGNSCAGRAVPPRWRAPGVSLRHA